METIQKKCDEKQEGIMKHCNTEIEIKKGKQNGKELFYAECPVCGIKHKAETEKAVEKYFNDAVLKVPTENNYQLATISTIPKDTKKLHDWYQSNLPAFRNETLKIQNKPATDRMIVRNYNYVMRIIENKNFKKVVESDIGLQSITDAFGDALSMAATLGEMGDIVPFGAMAEFIPNIECYKFALETGNNAPFRDIQIDLIHENDQTDNYQKEGNFYIEIKRGIPRGEIIAVVVSGIRTDTDKRVGEIYDVERLIAKAEQHSPSYRNYLIEKNEFKRLQVEGKLKQDAGGLYYQKDIPKADGGTWPKKVYEHDITNPYDGPDRPEMLRKAAGKSFFRPYMKTRNASAMAEEWNDELPETREQAADSVLNKAMSQFETANIKDADIVTENEKGLFNENEGL
jgi:hypothetical protein